MSNQSIPAPPPTQNQMSLIQFDDDDDDDAIPSTWQTFSRKFKEQPLVPIGAGATTIALVGAARAIQRGDSSTFNRWCRYRILFQGLTLVAALGGTMIYNYNKNNQEKIEANEQERIRQRDLRIQAQELNSNNNNTSSLASVQSSNLVSSTSNPLFQNQNQDIRKALQDRKRADHLNKSIHQDSSNPHPDDKK